MTPVAAVLALILAAANEAEDECLDCALHDCHRCADIEGLGCCCGDIPPDTEETT